MNIVIIMNIVRIQIISIMPKNRGHLYLSNQSFTYLCLLTPVPLYHFDHKKSKNGQVNYNLCM